MPRAQRRDHRWRRVRAVALTAAATLLALVPATPAFARAVPGTIVGTWTVQSVQKLPPGIADQGVATDGSKVITRGHAMIPAALRAIGWVHVGDPDSRDGIVVDAYQGSDDSRAKLFVLHYPNGTVGYFVHWLTAGETFHNSFAALTPDLRYVVSGEWGMTTRLQVFATPLGAAATSPRSPATLPLAGTITLAYPMRNVQGCVFATATTLLCTTNDTRTDLYPVARQLLSVHLSHPITAGHVSVTGTPFLLGAVPQDPRCPMPGESEGLDLHGRTLRIMVNSPCQSASLLTTYVHVTHIDDDD